MLDGVGAVDVGALMLDDVDEAVLHKHDDDATEESGHGGRFWLSPGLLLRHARSSIHAATHPRATIEKAVAAVDLVIRQELNPAPHTELQLRADRRAPLPDHPGLDRRCPPDPRAARRHAE